MSAVYVLQTVLETRARGMEAYGEAERGYMKLAKAALAATAIIGTAVVTAAIEAEKHVEEAGQAAFELGEKFGLSGGQASAWISIAKQVGVSGESVGKGFQFLAKNMESLKLMNTRDQMKELHIEATRGTAAQKAHAIAAIAMAEAQRPLQVALRTLGVSVMDSKGHLLDEEVVMRRIATAFAKMPDGPEKAGLAIKLFGRGGAEMIPILNQGADGIDRLKAKGIELGSVMGTDQVEALHKAFLAHKQYDQALEGLTNRIGIAVLPIATQFFDFMTNVGVPAIAGFANYVEEKAGPFVGHLKDDLSDAWGELKILIGKFGDAKQPAQDFIDKISDGATWTADHLAPGIKAVSDNLDTLKPIVEGMTLAFIGFRAVLITTELVEFIGAVHEAVEIGGILEGVMSLMGIKAEASATRAALAWIGAAVKTTGAWLASQAETAAIYALYAVDAVVNAAKTTAAWVVSAAKTTAAWAAARAQAAAEFAQMVGAAVLNAARVAAAWLASAAKVAAGWVATAATAIASYVTTRAAANENSNAAALVWLLGQARIKAGWVATSVSAAASFVVTKVQAGIQAVLTAAAWLGAQIVTAGGWAVLRAQAVASFVGTRTGAATSAGQTAGVWLLAQGRIVAGWMAAKAGVIGGFIATAAAATAQAAITAAKWLGAAAAMLVVRGATLLWAAAQFILDAALDANPISLIIIAIALLVAGVIWAYKNVGWFRAAVDIAWATVKGWALWIGQVLVPAFKNVGKSVGSAFDALGTAIHNTLTGVWDFLKKLPGQLWADAQNVGSSVMKAIISGISTMGGAVFSAIKSVLPGGANGPLVQALHAQHIPGFQFGGFIPGPPGSPQLVVAHGGEPIGKGYVKGDGGMDETNKLLRRILAAVTADANPRPGVEAALYRATSLSTLNRNRGMAGA